MVAHTLWGVRFPPSIETDRRENIMKCKGCYGIGSYDVCKDCNPAMVTCTDGDATGLVVLCDGCPECDGCPFDCQELDREHPDCKSHGRKA